MIIRLPDPLWFRPSPTAQQSPAVGQATPVRAWKPYSGLGLVSPDQLDPFHPSVSTSASSSPEPREPTAWHALAAAHATALSSG